MGVVVGIVVIGVVLVAAVLSPRRMLAAWALTFAVGSAVLMLWALSVGAWAWAGLLLVPLAIATYEFVHEVRGQRVRIL